MRRPLRDRSKQYVGHKVITLGAACLAICVLIYICSYTQQYQDLLHHQVGYSYSDPRRGAPHAKSAGTSLDRKDLAVALPSDELHYPLIQASWQWRKGIRTVVAVNDSQLVDAFNREAGAWQEQWVYWPDDAYLRGKYRGDTRAAIVPFLAHQALGETYKWMLYGDDDTQWFVEGVLDLVKHLDPEMPYFLTDNLWWSSINGTIGYQPHLGAPRCIPCSFNHHGRLPGKGQFKAPEGCPCTPKLLCTASEPGQFDTECNIPLHLAPVFSSRTYSMHGGAGSLLSVGLLKSVGLQEVIRCIIDHGRSTGGDAFLTICLWRLGYAPTDPGPWYDDPNLRLFDAAAALGSQSLADVLFEAAEGTCTRPICQEPFLLDKMVTSHIHSRRAGSMEKAAEIITRLSQAYQAYIDSKGER